MILFIPLTLASRWHDCLSDQECVLAICPEQFTVAMPCPRVRGAGDKVPGGSRVCRNHDGGGGGLLFGYLSVCQAIASETS